MYKWGRKEHYEKCKTHTHTGHRKETIYVYVEESTFKHRASSSISACYVCRDILADTGKESTSYGGCAARNGANSKGAYDDRDTETPAWVKQPARTSIIKCRDHPSATGWGRKRGTAAFWGWGRQRAAQLMTAKEGDMLPMCATTSVSNCILCVFI